MKLKLTVVNAPPSNPIAGQIFMLENGESIGRASSNNMVLQDEYRVISSRHAEVNLQGDQFVLVDLSSNGTFINSDAQSIGKGNVAPVNSGDLLIIGDYQFSVEVEAASASALPDGLGAVDFLDAPAPLADFKTEQSNSPSSPAPQTLSDSGVVNQTFEVFNACAANHEWYVYASVSVAGPARKACPAYNRFDCGF